MRVLITGGAGFIGSHLAERVLTAGNELTVIDSLDGNYAVVEKRANLEEIGKCGFFTFRQIDITDASAVQRVVQDFQPEVVVHLAAKVGVRSSVESPLIYENCNVSGTLHLLEACRALNPRPRFILGSSSSVYGISPRVPFRESDPLDCPVSPYAVSKLACEKYCFSYSHLYSIPTVCLRFFTVYGPRQRPDLAIRKFVESAIAGRPIAIFGDGASARDYTFVDDVVDGLTRAMELSLPFEAINLGGARPVMLRELLALIEDITGLPLNIHRLPEQAGDVPLTYADISKARELLGYCPKVAIREGIERFVAWRRAACASRAI